jgi:hypothetical protein
MIAKRWFVSAAVCSLLGAGVLALPREASAQPPACYYYRCAGCSKQGGYCTGLVQCQVVPCACPLPASDWNLTLNQCGAQLP